jgi:hypothetical protein
MACSGLHCAGCGGGAAVPAVLMFAAAGGAWVAEHLIEVAAVSVACAGLAFAAVAALARWSDRRAARSWAQRPAQLRAEPVRQVPAAGRPAIGPVYHFNFYGAAGDTHAAVIRKALTEGDHHGPVQAEEPAGHHQRRADG